MNKEFLEFVSRSNAGIKATVDGYNFVTVLGDIPMFTMPGDESVSPHLERDGFWESWISVWVNNHVDFDTFFVDVGANTGYYSFFAKRLGAQVVAVEANPKYAQLISNSGKRNGLRFPIYSVAVADKAGMLTLSVPDHLHGSASTMIDFVGSQWGGTNIKVQSLTLDMLLKVVPHKPKTIIKIDAEGAEENIWQGMTNTLIDRRPIVMLEWTPEAYSDTFYDSLSAYGDIYFINYEGGETPVDRKWIESQTDWVMLAIYPK